MEVHKFSKFIHGCAVLLHDEVRAIPYWMDDVTLSQSIIQSGAAMLLSQQSNSTGSENLLPHDSSGNRKPIHRSHVNHSDEEPHSNIISVGNTPADHSYTNYHEYDCTQEYCNWASSANFDHVTQQKVEPKLFFANERTFMKWLEMAVMMYSISVGVLAFTRSDGKAQYLAMIILPISLLFILYALWTFLWRSDLIKRRDVSRWDDPFGPVFLTSLLILVLSGQFLFKIFEVYVK